MGNTSAQGAFPRGPRSGEARALQIATNPAATGAFKALPRGLSRNRWGRVMREDNLRPSSNIEDRRGMGGAAKGGLGIGAIVVLSLLGWATGIDPRVLIGGAELVTGACNAPTQSAAVRGAPNDQVGGFVA